MNNQVPTFEALETVETESSREVEEERRVLSIRHFGNMMPIKQRPDGEPKYVLGPHFYVFLCTLIISSIMGSVMAYNVISTTKGRQIQIAIAMILALLFYMYSYACVGISNPGLASTTLEPTEQMKKNLRYCVPCRIVRPIRTIHCYQCDVCITGYDHHCPWVGKCVARENMCQFKCFLFSIMVVFFVFGICMFVANSYEPVKPVTVPGAVPVTKPSA